MHRNSAKSPCQAARLPRRQEAIAAEATRHCYTVPGKPHELLLSEFAARVSRELRQGLVKRLGRERAPGDGPRPC